MTLTPEEQIRVIGRIANESLAAGDTKGAAYAVDALVRIAKDELAREESRRRRRSILEIALLGAFAATIFVSVLVVTEW